MQQQIFLFDGISLRNNKNIKFIFKKNKYYKDNNNLIHNS